MELSRIDDRGRVVIPRELREQFGVRPGDYVALRVLGGKLTVVPVDVTAKERKS